MAPTKRASQSSQSPKRPKKKPFQPESAPESSASSAGTIAYPPLSNSSPGQTLFQQPSSLITFSYTPSRTLEFTNSALRYYIDPPPGAHLGYAYDRWIKGPEERTRLDSLLAAWSKAQQDVAKGTEIGLITWRGIMTKILIAPYEERDECDLNMMCINGTMYIEEHASQAKLHEKNTVEPRQRTQMYYGYAFESYCTSSKPGVRDEADPNNTGWGGDVNTNVQWCTVVKTKLGDTRIVIGGEVDCVRDKFTGQTDTYVELKTSLAIRGPHDEPKFEKKLLKFYFQSFLLGVPEIIVGFRTPAGKLTTTQRFKTIEIPRLVRGKRGAWDPLVCLDWGKQFIDFLKKHVEEHGRGSDDVWRIQLRPKRGVSVTLLGEDEVREVMDGESRVGILPKWYWDEVKGVRSPAAAS